MTPEPEGLRVIPIRPYGKTVWRQVLKRDPCAYCGYTGGEVDHIQPQGLAGSIQQASAEDIPDNWTGACRSCNASKRDWTLIGYLARPFVDPYGDIGRRLR